MKPSTWMKFVLLGLGSILVVAFAWGPAQGQMRVPRPPMPGARPFGPNMNPPGAPVLPGAGGPRIVRVWKCSGCGQELGRGLSAPPSTCPHCGARIINGFGNGIPQPGMPNTPTGPIIPPGANPNPGVPMNPPVFNPPPPGFNPAENNRVEVNAGTISGSSAEDSSSSLLDSPRKGLIIALVIGIIVVGAFILAGGTFVLIYALKGSASASPRRRRSRWDD